MLLDQKHIEKKVSEFINQSRELGLKVTPQRIAIYKELAKTARHPSTEMIYQNVKNHYPKISLTTVYRTLETFEKHGLISVVNKLFNAARYDANTEPHHHIICVKCKKIEDIYDNSINYSNTNLDFPEYEVLDYSILFNVICRECSESGTQY